MKQRDSAAGETYYSDQGDAYLAQRSNARSDYNQRLRASMFKDVASDEFVTLDFGCGTGGILSNLPAGKRIGVELGEQAANEARSKGIEVHSSLAQVPDDSVDLAISFHAIEHVDHPLAVLEEIVRVLKPGGRARLVVPCETPIRAKERDWRPNPDQHFYTWTPLNFGNLAARAGFKDVRCRLAPMPSGSRAARWLGTRSLPGRLWSTYISLRDNSYSVVLDAAA
jgi:ubiquinone/menaquinone biosynthesis C-methylase UbiE